MNTPVFYPMQLSPVCRSTIWGGNRMRDCFGFRTNLENIAEAWMLSARDDNPGFIIAGEYMGERIDRVLEKYPELIVRVCGFSAKFTSLSPDWQQEVLTRNFYE